MSFLAELKRRNVIRVAIAYIVGSWLLVQGADLVFDLIGADDWLLRAVAGVLALGFIPVVALAWAFEITPEGIRKEKDVDRTQSVTHQTAKKLDIATMVLVIGAVALLAVDRMLPEQGAGREQGSLLQQGDNASDEGGRSLAPAPHGTGASLNNGSLAADQQDSREQGSLLQPVSGKSIAVLPFANRSNQNDDLYFTDGIHDDLLTQLAKVGDLTVISRTSVMEYRDSNKNLKQIGDELKVATILEGGVQKVGNRVRINAQLIEVATDKHLWAETFDRELTAENIFELQSEIARKIVIAVAAQLTPEEEQLLAEVPTQNLAAYESYLRARDLYYGANYSRTQELAAQPLLERAIELDPDYTEAHALLANIYGQLYWRGIDTSEEFLVKYRATLDRAIASNPDSPLALRAQAYYHYRVENDYQRSLELLQQAQAVAPGNVDIYGDLGFTQRRLGLWDESISSQRRGLQLDPANRFYHSTLVETLAADRRWQEVLNITVPLADANPDDLDSQVTRATAQLHMTGDLEPLKNVFEQMNLDGTGQYTNFAAPVYLMLRDADAAIAVLEGPIWASVMDQGYSRTAHPWQMAAAWRIKGDAEKARAYDEQIVSQRDAVMKLGLQDRFYGLLDIAVALARLGRLDEAQALIKLVEIELPPGRDAMLWGSLPERRAMVRAMAGDEAGAIEDLQIALTTPYSYPLTPWLLQYNPDWDFFRHNERFNELATPDGLVREKSL